MIFHVVVSLYRLVKIWNLPQSPAQFRNGQLKHQDRRFAKQGTGTSHSLWFKKGLRLKKTHSAQDSARVSLLYTWIHQLSGFYRASPEGFRASKPLATNLGNAPIVSRWPLFLKSTPFETKSPKISIDLNKTRIFYKFLKPTKSWHFATPIAHVN